MHIRPVRQFVCLAMFLLVTSPLAAQAGTLQGTVSDSAGVTLPNASVSVEGTGLRATAGANGGYEVRGIPAGTYTVRVRLIGFQSATSRISVAEGAVLEQDFTLARSTVQLAPIDVVVGSRARHTAAEELAVPVDIYPAEQLTQQGSTETSIILQSVSPSINFPRQSVTDAGDVVRPFTLRGLSPDHTLVLVNGWRRHQTALVNNFTYGMGAGSSGVDLNAIPSSALDRIEVLRDGAAAQYGSDAIAGVVNLVLKDGGFTPFINADAGRYTSDDYPDDGTTVNVNGGYGIGIGRGSLGVFGEFRNREPTNRAWADPFEAAGTGVPDEVDEDGKVVKKNNPVPQPNHHWGDGLERDALAFANFRMPVNESGSSEIYSFGGYSHRDGEGNPYRRYFDSGRNWQQIYPLGFLPTIGGLVTDYSAAGGLRGLVSGWNYDLGAEFGHNGFDYEIGNTLNASLGPCLDVACAPGADGVLGNADDPGIPNQQSFFAGRVLREEFITALNIAKPVELGLRNPVNLAFGAAFRRERYAIREGELASYVNGGAIDQNGDGPAPGGSQSFPGFAPGDATDRHRNNFGLYADAETNLSEKVLANAALRFENYSDFGSRVSGKASVRFQPSRRVTLRAAASTGFRAPGLSQVAFSKVVTNVIAGEFIDVGIFPADNPAAQALGARPLEEETAYNLSAGIVLTPVDNFTLTADYFHIRINDQILLGATFDDDASVGLLTAAGFGNIGGVQYFSNGLDTRTQGLDITAGYRVPTAAGGTLDLSAGFNVTRNKIVNVDPLPQVLVDAGSTEPGLLDSVTAIGIEDERPDWRGTLQANYSVGRFTTLGRFSYYGGFSSAQPGFCDLCRENYGGKGLVDAEVGYRFNLVKLSLGVRNLFDVYPDQPSSTVVVDEFGDTSRDFNNNFGTFPWAAASPFGYNGRFVYARTEIQLAR
ncbi:MAG TPA: TonB-dependent receptor [Gemmatimonadales bacterium]|nr:TonB-dependent receptor [Gemmatimonadales bacterium]